MEIIKCGARHVKIWTETDRMVCFDPQTLDVLLLAWCWPPSKINIFFKFLTKIKGLIIKTMILYVQITIWVSKSRIWTSKFMVLTSKSQLGHQNHGFGHPNPWFGCPSPGFGHPNPGFGRCQQRGSPGENEDIQSMTSYGCHTFVTRVEHFCSVAHLLHSLLDICFALFLTCFTLKWFCNL